MALPKEPDQGEEGGAVVLRSRRHGLQALVKFLLCVDFSQPEIKEEASKLLQEWENNVDLDATDALQLLSVRCRRTLPLLTVQQGELTDYGVRAAAVRVLRKENDEAILNILQPLVQVCSEWRRGVTAQALRYEMTTLDRSPLIELLFERASRNSAIAFTLQWYLHTEKSSPDSSNKSFVVRRAHLLLQPDTGLQMLDGKLKLSLAACDPEMKIVTALHNQQVGIHLLFQR